MRSVLNWVWIGLLIIVGGIAAEMFGNKARAGLEAPAMAFAANYAYGMERLGHSAVRLDTPQGDAHYAALIDIEGAWLQRNPAVAEIYTYRRLRDGFFVYVSGCERDGDKAGQTRSHPIGQKLPVVTEFDAHAATGDAVFDSTPLTGEQGLCVRALQPLLDSNGKVEGVLGVKFPAGPWFRTLLRERLIALARIYALFVLIGIIVFVSRQRVKQTNRDQVEAKLRESENRFRSLCENIPNVAVQGYDRERRVIFWNQASVNLYGYTREEAIGQPLEDLIIPAVMRQGVIDAIENWYKTGVAIPPGELWLQRKDGGPVNVVSSHVMQHNRQGEPEMYCVDIELTDRNNAMAALARSEANHRTLFEVSPHPMWVYDVQTLCFLAVNTAAIEHFGYTREEFLKLGLCDMSAPDLRASIIEHVRTVPFKGPFGPAEWRQKKRNGENVVSEFVSHSMAWEGRRARVVLAQDVTSRREAERRFVEQAELLDKTTEAIVVVDNDERVTFWNRGAAQLFGQTAKEVQGKTLEDLKAKAGAAIAALAGVLSSNPSDWRGEFRTIGQNNRPLFIETGISVIRDANGQPTARISVSADISRRKTLETQVVQTQKMEVLGQLAGGVAHDFNSILMAMMLNLDMLSADLRLNSEAQVMLGELKTMTQGGARLIGQLLMFARKHAMVTETLELNAALGAVTKMLQRLLGADIALEMKGGGTALWIDADPCMLDQVVMNLCVNSRDAMPRGGKLTIQTSRVELNAETSSAPLESHSGVFACLSVSDNGSGMSPEVLAHAFEPFFTTKEVGKGTGLGLSTVHGIVHQHHGWITVDSAVGKGTTFKIFLPIVTKPETDALEKVESNLNGGEETILLVEDDDAVRRICAAMLLRFGYRVLPSASGQAALRIWEQNPGAIDLLLSDVILPGGISGLELAEQLLKKRPSLAVVIMSGNNSEIIKADGLSEKGLTFVQKPIESAKLAQVIRRCLD
jgi:PAS domain S-box-containing protein